MFYSVVTWPIPLDSAFPSMPDDKKVELQALAETLAPGFNSVITVAFLRPLHVIAIRTWPSEEIAQQWVDHFNANFDVESAVVTSEPVDLSEYMIYYSSEDQ